MKQLPRAPGKRPAAARRVALAARRPAAKPAVSPGATRASPRAASTKGFKDRPTAVVRISDYDTTKAVREKYGALKFSTRKKIQGQDINPGHGDAYIVKKMFRDRPYEEARRKHAGSLPGRLRAGVLQPSEGPGSMFKKVAAGRVVGRRLLDLGANIGTFGIQAGVNGCEVVHVEFDGENFRMLEKNVRRNRKLIDRAGGRVTNLEGAVVPRAALKRPVYSFPKVHKNSAKNEGSFRFRPDRPNRCSTIQDRVNNGTRGEKIKNKYCLQKLVEKHKPEIVKIDIEGAERDIFEELASECRKAGRAGAKSKILPGVEELYVYFHLDKFPKLHVFREFLENLETVFPVVRCMWTPKCPNPKCPKSAWDWRERSKRDRELEGRTDIGVASSKWDVLCLCAK